MQKKVSFQLEDAVEVPNWAEAYPEHKFAVYRCCFLSTKENSHHIPITEEILKKCAPSILGTWLVAKIEWGDSTTHKKDEQIYGYFPMEQKIEFVEDENDDVLKAYAYAVVSKRYSKEFNGIFEFDNLRNSSVEMMVDYADDDEDSVIGFDIEALTCLGKTVNGSCPDADIRMIRFSEKEAETFFKKNNSSNLTRFVQERKESMAGKTYKIDKSKESMSTKPWGEIDKTDLRNKIMEASNKEALVKACYMLVEDGWEEAPSQHLKYPVMCFEGDKLVYNRYGLSSALAYANQEDEKSVINKIKAIYKKLDLDDDSERKEEKDMNEIEFSAVNIGDLWGRLYSGMREARQWNYSIKGIYEQDNQKFAIVYDNDMKLYRLNFSLTEDGLTLADEIVEVKEDFIETDDVKKFAEPEDVEKYQLCQEAAGKDEEADKEFEEEKPEEDKEEKKVEMSLEEAMDKISQLEKDIEDKDNIIMERDNDIAKCNEELQELRKFKEDVEEKQKAQNVESILEEVKNYMSEEQLSNFRKEGLACEMSQLDSWSNKVKAVSFETAKNIKNSKKEDGVWSFSAPVSAPKKNGLWD